MTLLPSRFGRSPRKKKYYHDSSTPKEIHVGSYRDQGNNRLVEVQFTQDKIKFTTSIKCVRNASKLQIGDIRSVKYKDGFHYSAIILKFLGNNFMEVQFKRDKIKFRTSIKSVKNATKLQAGDIRLVKWLDGKYYSARIVKFSDPVKNNTAENRSKEKIGIGKQSSQVPRTLPTEGTYQVPLQDTSSTKGSSVVPLQDSLSHEAVSQVTVQNLTSTECISDDGLQENRPTNLDVLLQDISKSNVSNEGDSQVTVQELISTGGHQHNRSTETSLDVPLRLNYLTEGFSETPLLESYLTEGCSNLPLHNTLITKPNSIPLQSQENHQPIDDNLQIFSQITLMSSNTLFETDLRAPAEYDYSGLIPLQESKMNEGVVSTKSSVELCELLPLQIENEKTSVLKITNDEANHCQTRRKSKIVTYNYCSSEDSNQSDPDWMMSDSDDTHMANDSDCLNTKLMETLSPTSGNISPKINLNYKDHKCEDKILSNKEKRTEENLENNMILPFSTQSHKTKITELDQTSFYTISSSISLQKPATMGIKRIYDKKQACLFCKKILCKLPQHLESMHKDKKQVQEYLSLAKNTKERANKIRQLRNKGNFIHNATVLKEKTGSLLVFRRSSKDLSYSDYLPCEYCFGYFNKRKLHRHVHACPDKGHKKLIARSKVQRNAFLLTPTDEHSNEIFRQILANMHQDLKASVVRADPLLCTFGSKEAMMKKDLPHTRNHTSYKVRLLAELIIHLKESKTGITTAIQCVMPDNFDIIVRSVLAISVEKEKPSNGLKIGHNLKKCARILRSKCIIEGNELLRKKVEDFLTLYSDEWEDRVAQPLHTKLYQRKFNTAVKIPSTEDIMKLNSFILKKETEFISKNFIDVNYVEVAYIVLCHVIVFNRRRVGEVSLMEKKSFLNRVRSTKPQGEIEEILSDAEKKLYTQFEIVHVRGKKGTKVDCLLTSNMIRCMDFLLNSREENGVLANNIYLFCLPHSQFCMRGCDAVKYVAKQSGADFPSDLKSTKLRKHICTVSQLLNLKDNEINSLCKHMSHNPNVHREFYQMPEELIQKTQIAKILLALEQGTIKQHKGKALNEFEMTMSANKPTQEIEVEDSANRTLTSSSDEDEENSPKEIIHIRHNQETKRRKAPTIREQWSQAEVAKLQLFFAKELILATGPPTKKRCDSFMSQFPEFKKRGSYLKIKWRVNALIQKSRKNVICK